MLIDEIVKANVVCVVYDVTAEESLERVCVYDGHEWLYIKSIEQLLACSA